MAYTTSNLVIIGNGFDLAHGLKTSYGDFIKWLVEEEINNPHPDNPLFKKARYIFESSLQSKDPSKSDKEQLLEQIYTSSSQVHTSEFFRTLLRYSGRGEERNWADIEGFYFRELELHLEGKIDVKKTNEEFEIIKNRFEEYLVAHTKDKKAINSYQAFFDKLHDNTLILNFNYTDTVQLYEQDKNKIVNIHGELQNPDNPMIFGYAAKEADLDRLYEKNDNQFLFNIKQNRYGDSISESRLDNFLAKAAKNEGNQGLYKGVRIFIFGHSCGISDEYILHRIVNHEKVNEIRIFYYDGIPHQHYEIRTNLKRIMNDRAQEHKIQNVHKCHRMPQCNDGKEEEKGFGEYLEEHFKFKKAAQS